MTERLERVDGRNARRDRNTEAVLDAAHELFVDGNLSPSVEDVAARSGVSLRSVYRYFEDVDALMRAAIARRVELLDDLFVLTGLGEGGLAERIERYVDHRLMLHQRLAPAVRAAVLRAPTAPPIAEQLRRRRQQLAEQTERHFALEFTAMGTVRAAAIAACVDALFQFEAMEHLRSVRRLTKPKVRSALVAGLSALLEPPAQR
jgi:AcrR family transcriptional regulator